MPNSDDICYEVGPDAYAAMSHFSVREIADADNVIESIKTAIWQIAALIEPLGKDETSPYYENELLFRNALMNIKNEFEDNMSRIDRAINFCDLTLGELDEVCYYEAVTESFLKSWGAKVKGEGMNV